MLEDASGPADAAIPLDTRGTKLYWGYIWIMENKVETTI